MGFLLKKNKLYAICASFILICIKPTIAVSDDINLCQHQQLEQVYQLSLKGQDERQYSALLELLRDRGVSVEGSKVLAAFIDCVSRFRQLHSEFSVTAASFGDDGVQLKSASGAVVRLAQITSHRGLHRQINKLIKNLRLSPEEQQALWFLWVEATIAATGDRFNYYVYADQMEYQQFISGGRSFAVGFTLQRDQAKLIVDVVTDETLRQEGLRHGAQIMEISSDTVRAQNKYSWWLQQVPFHYRLRFEANGQLKDIEARSVPFKSNEFVSDIWGDIAYIRINSFTGRSSIEMSRLMRDVADHAKAILLDLRFNGGGVVSPVIPDYFLKPSQQVMVYKYLDEEKVHVPGSVAYTHLPVAILQNRYSASMSEIIAAAIQKQGRGVVIGERSFGKGVGQTMYPIKAEGSVALVETRFFFPDGRKSWHQQGIEPNIHVDVSEAEMDRLVGHLFSEHINLDKTVKFDKALAKAREILAAKILEP